MVTLGDRPRNESGCKPARAADKTPPPLQTAIPPPAGHARAHTADAHAAPRQTPRMAQPQPVAPLPFATYITREESLLPFYDQLHRKTFDDRRLTLTARRDAQGYPCEITGGIAEEICSRCATNSPP